MNLRDTANQPCLLLVLALAAGLAGCQDPDVGTIKADRGAAVQFVRANPGQSAPPVRSKSSPKRPDTNDLSPRLRGGETHP
jgi:hypothetical protein